METACEARMTAVASVQEQLSELFGSYKAEWLRDRMFDLFAEPSYFPESPQRGIEAANR